MPKPIEMPWAYATRKGFTGTAPGLYYRYFYTREEAEKSVRWMKKRKQWHGPIEYRPGECRQIGHCL